MSIKKKIIIAVASILAVALVVGGVFTVLRLQREPAKVYALGEVSNSGGDMGGNTLSGNVRSDRIQTVFPSDTQTITEVLVTLGQSVKKGDALMTYDTSLSALQLERKNLEIQKLERDLLHTKEEYNALVGYRAYTLSFGQDGLLSMSSAFLPAAISFYSEEDTTPTEPTETTEPTEPTETTDPTEPTDPTETTDPTEPTEPTDVPGVLPADGIVKSYALVGGDGSEAAPVLCVFADGNPFDSEFLAGLLGSREKAYVVLVQCEENVAAGIVTSALKIELTKTETGYTFALLDASDYIGDTLENYGKEPEPIDPIDPFDPGGGGMSYAELQKLKAEKAEQIRSLDLDIRMAKVEYTGMQKELGDGTIRAEIDGVVTLLNDAETAAMNAEALIKISDGGGYYIQGAISELSLHTVQPGQSVSIFSWFSGETVQGTVSSVSEYPTTSYGWGNGNPNTTYYAFEVFVDGDANLMEGDSVDLTLSAAAVSDDAIYLDKMFVLLENGKYYVYVRGENDLLEKREVAVGKILWDSYYEIRGELTGSDYIAFPYGKTVVQGAKTEVAELEDLYNY